MAAQLSSRAKAQLWLEQAARLEAAQEEGSSEEEEEGTFRMDDSFVAGPCESLDQSFSSLALGQAQFLKGSGGGEARARSHGYQDLRHRPRHVQGEVRRKQNVRGHPGSVQGC